jgi:hypothetical protein
VSRSVPRLRPASVWRWLAAISVAALVSLGVAAPVAATSTGPGGINFVFGTGLTVSGKITNAANVGAGGIDVAVCQDDPQNCGAGTITAADGTYTVPGLTSGTYYAMAIGESPRNYRNTWYAGASSTTDPGAATTFAVSTNTSGINIKLASGLTVSGTVTDGANPISGVFVDIGGNGSGSGTTDAQGHYTVGGLGPGSASMFVRPPFTSNYMPGFVIGGTVAEGFDSEPFDVSGDVTGQDVTLVSGNSISGHISGLTAAARVDAAGSAAGYSLDVAPNGDFIIPALWPDQPVQLIVEGPDDPTGIGGQFPVGVYDGTPNLNIDQSAAVTLDLSGGDITGLNLNAPLAASVHGNVTGEDAVALQGWITMCGDPGCVTSVLGTNGAYALVNVPDGSYTLYVVAAEHEGGYVTATGVSPNVGDADPVVVSGGDVTRDVVVPVGYTISGHVSGPSGQAITGAPVSASRTNGALAASALTDASGNYTIRGLSSGDYNVFANHPDDSNYIDYFYWNPSGNTPDYSQAGVITLPATATFITGTTPTNGATSVARTASMSVTFSDAVLGPSVTTVWLHELGSTKHIVATVTYDASTHTVVLTPKTRLRGKTTFVFEVSGITAADATPIAPISLQFTTRR